MIFHGLLGTCSYFLKFLVCAYFEKFCLLRDNPCIGPQECGEVVLKNVLKSVCVKSFYFEQVLKISTYSKKVYSFSSPLENAILLLRSR